MADMAALESFRQLYRSSLHDFEANSTTFQILDTISPGGDTNSRPGTLYVLDSSFNPPTVAHSQMIASALRAAYTKDVPPSRLLLLLAVQNADKPQKPALFEDRLVMMRLAAEDLYGSLLKDSARDGSENSHIRHLAIDIGVTKHPYFVDKAVAITENNGSIYPKEVKQVHLTGYDTLIRIFDTKYYPAGSLSILDPFFSRHRLRVTLRPDASWGNRNKQRSFLESLTKGTTGKVGAQTEWADHIELVEINSVDGTPVSSTTARDASQQDLGLLSRLVSPRVYQYIVDRELYVVGR